MSSKGRHTPARDIAAIKGNIVLGNAVICATNSGGWALPGGRETFCRGEASIVAQRLDRLIATAAGVRGRISQGGM